MRLQLSLVDDVELDVRNIGVKRSGTGALGRPEWHL
jgi:hypothetical protein